MLKSWWGSQYTPQVKETCCVTPESPPADCEPAGFGQPPFPSPSETPFTLAGTCRGRCRNSSSRRTSPKILLDKQNCEGKRSINLTNHNQMEKRLFPSKERELFAERAQGIPSHVLLPSTSGTVKSRSFGGKTSSHITLSPAELPGWMMYFV